MKFECPSCKKFGQVDDSKVPDEGMYANCPTCKTRFLISRPTVDFTLEPVQIEAKQTPPLTNQANPPEQNKQTTVDRSQIYRMAIGKNTDYYIPIFNRFDKDESLSASWNWAAFFGGWIWFCYRKMRKLGTILFLLLFVLIIAGKLDHIGFIAMILNLSLQIGVGIYSNKIYYKHIRDKVDAAENNILLSSSGGVSNVFLYIAYGFIGIALLGIIAAIIIPQIGKATKVPNNNIPSQTVSNYPSQTTSTSKK